MFREQSHTAIWEEGKIMEQRKERVAIARNHNRLHAAPLVTAIKEGGDTEIGTWAVCDLGGRQTHGSKEGKNGHRKKPHSCDTVRQRSTKLGGPRNHIPFSLLNCPAPQNGTRGQRRSKKYGPCSVFLNQGGGEIGHKVKAAKPMRTHE